MIHVERRPSAVRTSDAGTVSEPLVVWTTSERRRPDGVGAAGRVDDAAVDAELRLHRSRAEENGAPAVVRRGLVPRIRSRDEVRDVEPEDVGGARGLAARRREVVRRRDLPAVQDDLAGRLRDRLGRRRLLARDAAVHLAAHVRVEVERLALHEVRERVRAGRDGLRLQNLGRPAVRHLARDDALEVALERSDVHDAQELALRDELELAPIGAAVECEQRLLAGPERPVAAPRSPGLLRTEARDRSGASARPWEA